MKKLTNALLLVFACACCFSYAGNNEMNWAGEWIYLVKTEPSEPHRDAEFNQWYDEIDIPDVLAVPSFRRARRSKALSVVEFSDVRAGEGDGAYAAYYDIVTENIDKSIIDLYVAARKMNALGRSTDALRVVEANYYRLLNRTLSSERALGMDRYFLIQKVICCGEDEEISEFSGWFSETLVPNLKLETRFVEGGLFQLYRVMEELAVGEDEQPHLLMAIVVDAESAKAALSGLNGVLGGFQVTGTKGNPREVRDSILYRQMSDVLSD